VGYTHYTLWTKKQKGTTKMAKKNFKNIGSGKKMLEYGRAQGIGRFSGSAGKNKRKFISPYLSNPAPNNDDIQRVKKRTGLG
jgi:hypothetical protein